MTEPAFREPRALRRSVTDRLAALVRADARLDLNDLLRQFAYDRLLCRIFSGPDADRWVLKGATALLVRLGPDARHTLDVDLYRRSSGADEAEGSLRTAAGRDIGDLFHFEIAPGRPVAGPGETRRLRVVAYLGATQLASFGIDLATDLNMTGPAEEMGPSFQVFRQVGTACTPCRITSPTRCARFRRCTNGPSARRSRAPATATWSTWRRSPGPPSSTLRLSGSRSDRRLRDGTSRSLNS